MSQDDVTSQVRALEAMDLPALRDLWRTHYGAAPKLRSAPLLRRLLAWRLQSDALGPLDRKSARTLAAAVPPPAPRPKVREGVRLAREWQGRTYQVEAVNGAYVLEGVRYASLSEVARSITGVRWNGPRFFGLREAA